jgi:hypothetical protein
LLSHSLSSSGSFAMLTAIRRASQEIHLLDLDRFAFGGTRIEIAEPLAGRSAGDASDVWNLLKVKPELSSQEFLFQRIAVGRDGRIAGVPILWECIFKCLKLRFFGLADHKSLIYSHIAVDHCQ